MKVYNLMFLSIILLFYSCNKRHLGNVFRKGLTKVQFALEFRDIISSQNPFSNYCYRLYLPKKKLEIIAAPSKSHFFIFKDVTQASDKFCSSQYENLGNGYLVRVVNITNYHNWLNNIKKDIQNQEIRDIIKRVNHQNLTNHDKVMKLNLLIQLFGNELSQTDREDTIATKNSIRSNIISKKINKKWQAINKYLSVDSQYSLEQITNFIIRYSKFDIFKYKKDIINSLLILNNEIKQKKTLLSLKKYNNNYDYYQNFNSIRYCFSTYNHKGLIEFENMFYGYVVGKKYFHEIKPIKEIYKCFKNFNKSKYINTKFNEIIINDQAKILESFLPLSYIYRNIRNSSYFSEYYGLLDREAYSIEMARRNSRGAFERYLTNLDIHSGQYKRKHTSIEYLDKININQELKNINVYSKVMSEYIDINGGYQNMPYVNKFLKVNNIKNTAINIHICNILLYIFMTRNEYNELSISDLKHSKDTLDKMIRYSISFYDLRFYFKNHSNDYNRFIKIISQLYISLSKRYPNSIVPIDYIIREEMIEHFYSLYDKRSLLIKTFIANKKLYQKYETLYTKGNLLSEISFDLFIQNNNMFNVHFMEKSYFLFKYYREKYNQYKNEVEYQWKNIINKNPPYHQLKRLIHKIQIDNQYEIPLQQEIKGTLEFKKSISENMMLEKVNIQWIRVPSGKYLNKKIPTFLMSKTEVTVRQYKQCVHFGACSIPKHGKGCNWGLEEKLDHPINCVTWQEANQFAQWMNADLPFVAEWEYASLKYKPFFRFNKHRLKRITPINNQSKNGTMPVAQHSSNEFGLYDMLGSVWEWCADSENLNLQNFKHIYPLIKKLDCSNYCLKDSSKVYVGGSWKSEPYLIDTQSKIYTFDKKKSSIDIGFRIVQR